MFSDKKDKKQMEPNTSQNRINEGTHLTGDIVSKGFFRIDGSIEGSLSQPSKVVLGKTGFFKGKLVCSEADLEGKFEGNLHVTGTLTLRATANVEGEVIMGKLAVEPGATLNANCSMQNGKQPTSASSDNSTSPYDRQNRTKKAIASKKTEI